MPELALRTSTRRMPCESSAWKLSAPSTGRKKLGQPQPLSNFVSLRKSGAPLSGSTKRPARFSPRCAPLKGRSPPAAQFRTPLLYRCVRHPLYLGFLLTFWAVPVMTAGRLLFALGFSAYILIGIAFEERDLVAQFGERYRRYREQVGMLVPRRRAKSHDELRSAPPR